MTSYQVHKDKPDANLQEIRDAAHQIGALTYRWRLLDLIVVFRGEVQIWEIKEPGKRLTQGQQETFSDMRRNGYIPHVITTVEEAAEALGQMGYSPRSSRKVR